MKRNRKNGFSLLEVIAAVIILAVVAAATVATVAPMRQKSDDKLSDQTVASLDAMSQTYFLEQARYPRSINDLVNGGYLSNTTPDELTRVRDMNRKYTVDRTTGRWAKR